MPNDGQQMPDGFYYHVSPKLIVTSTTLFIDKRGRVLGGKLRCGAYLNNKPEPHNTIRAGLESSAYVYKVYARKIYYEAKYADYISAHATVVACLGTVGELFPHYFGNPDRLTQHVGSIVKMADLLKSNGDKSIVPKLEWAIDRIAEIEYETEVMRYELPDEIILQLIDAEEVLTSFSE